MSELERSVAHRGAEPALGRPAGTGVGTYVAIGLVIFLFTAIEVLVVNTGVLAGLQKPLIVVLMSLNFVLSALYYQGLQHDNATHQVTFGVGVFLGLLVAVSLLVLMQLGLTLR